MKEVAILAQLVVALAVVFVWTFRYPNVVRDFQHFGYSSSFRNAVGVFKVALATLLVIGIWVPSVTLVAAFAMATMMLGAQWAHASVRNPLPQRLPSALLLGLSTFVAIDAARLST